LRGVFDTSVLVAATRSRRGASCALLGSIPSPDFHAGFSTLPFGVALPGVAKRADARRDLAPGRTAEDTLRYLRYLASQVHLQEIHFLWRPFLRDADDEMVLELAFAASCRHIVTHNVRDFNGSEELGITALSPREFLNLIRKKS
jgi:predicted nucleic acid-binding protein